MRTTEPLAAARPAMKSASRYSGQLRLRLPRSLHEHVSELASAEGVSLNTLLLSLIAEGCGRRGPARLRPVR